MTRRYRISDRVIETSETLLPSEVFDLKPPGFLSCSQPTTLQEICDSLGPEEIDRVFRKWLGRIPLPLRPQDRWAGYDWDLSIWQMEVSLTQIFDRPLRGRESFEEIIRDNLDLGRPDRVQLIFDRVVTKKTPGQFRTRVIQDGVHPTAGKSRGCSPDWRREFSALRWSCSPAMPPFCRFPFAKPWIASMHNWTC